MGGGPHHKPPRLVRAESGDIPRLVDLYINAESESLLHKASNPSESQKRKDCTEVFNLVIDRPDVIFMKAIDVETKQIGAFALWQLINYNGAHTAANMYPRSVGASGVMLMSHREDRAPSPTGPLGRYMHDNFLAFLDSWCFATKNIYTVLLMTDPPFQRRGMGTALMHHGHGRADQDGVPMSLIATPAGYPLYLRLGWKEVSTGLTLDLREWAPDAGRGDQGWGNYRFYYMMRLPRVKSV